MASNQAAEKVAPYVFLGITAVTGLVDAVSFLSLGRVFTANMTGNVVFSATLGLAAAISTLCNAALFRSLRAGRR
jgi:uncharacterized membrane protein YoaK (UPF0700 family)